MLSSRWFLYKRLNAVTVLFFSSRSLGLFCPHLPPLHHWLLWSACRLSDTPPDNANWCQTRAYRPLCLTPSPFLISLIVHFTSYPRSHFASAHNLLILFPPNYVCPNVFAISLRRLSMACADSTALTAPQSQVSFPAQRSFSFCKTGRLQSNWRWCVSFSPSLSRQEYSLPPAIPVIPHHIFISFHFSVRRDLINV